MIKQSQECAIHDDTKLVRFLDLNGAEKSIGIIDHDEIECTFHFGLLSHYKTLESNAGDAKEGSTSIRLPNGIVGSETTANNALISCWSIWNKNHNPWISFKDSAFAKDEKNVCVIVSTLGNVKNIFQQIIEINKLLLGENFSQIVLASDHDRVRYYPREIGVNYEHWFDITDPIKHGLGAKTKHNIFHKRDSNQNRQRYDAENEYRFAMILGHRYFFGCDSRIGINAQDAILRDYLLTLRDDSHYIEKVYLRVAHPIIESTCFYSGIELVKQEEPINA